MATMTLACGCAGPEPRRDASAEDAPAALLAVQVALRPAEPASTSELLLLGRVRIEDGTPGANVRARLLGAYESLADVFAARVGAERDAPVPVSDSGRIDARVRVPFAGPYVLEIGADDGVKRWIWLERGERIHSLGTVELTRAGSLEVHVLDAAERLDSNAWAVGTPSERLCGSDGSFVYARRAHARCESGRAWLHGIPEGEVSLAACSHSGREIARGTVRCVAGQSTRVALSPP